MVTTIAVCASAVSRNVVAVRLPPIGAVFDVGLSSALRGQRRRQVQVRPDRHAAEYGRHGDGRNECGSRQVVRDGPKQSARGLHTEWGTTMSVPMPSAKNCGLDASMRGFRPEPHASRRPTGVAAPARLPAVRRGSENESVCGRRREQGVHDNHTGEAAPASSCSRTTSPAL